MRCPPLFLFSEDAVIRILKELALLFLIGIICFIWTSVTFYLLTLIL